VRIVRGGFGRGSGGVLGSGGFIRVTPGAECARGTVLIGYIIRLGNEGCGVRRHEVCVAVKAGA